MFAVFQPIRCALHPFRCLDTIPPGYELLMVRKPGGVGWEPLYVRAPGGEGWQAFMVRKPS